ncbi:hypothetical protein U1Q18_028436, partial [Sarracenia purpurea var. burkii]
RNDVEALTYQRNDVEESRNSDLKSSPMAIAATPQSLTSASSSTHSTRFSIPLLSFLTASPRGDGDVCDGVKTHSD